MDEASGPPVLVWPDNWPVVQLFSKFISQWRVGFAGPSSLDYMPVMHYMDRLKLNERDYDDLLDGISTMEDAALEKMREDQAQK